MAVRGFQQVDGLHYDDTDNAAPAVADRTTAVVFVLMVIGGYVCSLV